NHRSYLDPLVIGYALAARGRPGRFLGKSELFESRGSKELVEAMGTIPVFRGTGSDEPLAQAAAALEADELVVILPEGTIPRGSAFFEPELDFKPGTARLAAQTGAPVIPMGLWGTEAVWPRNARVPAVALPWEQPPVSIAIGPAVKLKHKSEKADTRRIRDAVVDQLPPEAREQRIPTDAELAATYPDGKIPDGD
ncbi:MAG: lysophospholipid acyltransferase family protein, partial [Actinomycetota bacterium]